MSLTLNFLSDLELRDCREDEHDDRGQEEQGGHDDQDPRCRGAVWTFRHSPDVVPYPGTAHSLELVFLKSIDTMMHKRPYCSEVIF